MTIRSRRALKAMWPNDPNMRVLIDSLYREYYGLYQEKYDSDPEKWLRNSIDQTVDYGQTIGQGHQIKGNQSIAIGIGHTTSSYREIMMGSYGADAEAISWDNWDDRDRLFSIGNGVDAEHKHDAFRMYKSGYSHLDNALRLGAYSWGVKDPEPGAIQFKADSGFEGYMNDKWNRFAILPANLAAGLLTVDAAGVIGSIVNNAANWDTAFSWGNHAGLYAPAGTVSFPGFGTTHTLAAYGDHTHDYSAYYAPASTVSFPGYAGSFGYYGVSSYAARADHSHNYEPAITKGTALQYFRGDMSLATFPTSMPASDVYSWAKAVSKPTYTYSEVGAAPSSTVSFPGYAGSNGYYGTSAYAARADHSHAAPTHDGLVNIKGTPYYAALNPQHFTYESVTDSIFLNTTDTPAANSPNPISAGGVYTQLQTKQSTLISGTNIKTINGTSILGSGNITITGGGVAWGSITGLLPSQTDLQNALDAKAALAGSLSQAFSTLKLNLPGGSYVEVQGTTIHIYAGSNIVQVHGTVTATEVQVV